MSDGAASQGPTIPDELDDIVQLEFPFPIAVTYKSLLETSDLEEQADLCLRTFYVGIRAISLALIVRYLRSSEPEINLPELNRKIREYLPASRPHHWIELLRDVLRAYKGHRDLLFIPEIYDLYWEESARGSQIRDEPWILLERMAALGNDIGSGRINRSAKAAELLQMLRQILGHFVFMRNYDLWNIVSRQDNTLTIDIHNGLSIRRMHVYSQYIVEPDFRQIKPNYYYMADRQGHLLELDPLLINPGMLHAADMGMPDMGVFNAYYADDSGINHDGTLEYLLLAADIKDVTNDRDLVHKFLDLYEDQLQRKELVLRSRLPLNWENLRQVLSLFSQQQMISALSKYSDRVYVERTALSAIMLDFLQSPKTAMVITGDAGVGKTNLLVHVYQELLLPRSDTAAVWLDGADLNVQRSLAQTLLGILDRYVNFGEDPAGTDDLAERALRRVLDGPLYGRSLIVIVDGVNENNDPVRAFQLLNDFINKSASLPIKLLLSSRPHVWRYVRQNALKPYRQVNYYARSPHRKVGDEASSLEHDSFALSRYTREELEEAFALYTRAEGIEGASLRQISSVLVEALREPLLLRITCEAYQGRSLPADISIDSIIPRLIERLVEDPNRTLTLSDIEDFLEGQIVPQFFPVGGIPVNRLTRNMLRKVKVGRGKTLDDLVADKTPYTDGTRVNQQFQDLMDTGWLIRTGEALNYEIRFRYEYFYEYFAGGYLTRLSDSQRDKLAFFEAWIARMEQAPFLWGVIRNMLVSLIRDSSNMQIIRSLAINATSFRKDLLVSVLVEAHRIRSAEVETIVNELIDERYLRARSPFAPIVALETAYEIRNIGLLTKGLCHPSSELRAITVQLIYQLWVNGHNDVSLSVLRASIDRIKLRHILRTSHAFQGAIVATLLIALYDYERNGFKQSHLIDMQRLWQPVVRRFRFLLGSKPQRGSIRWRLRRGAMRLVAPLIVRNADTVEKAQQLVFSVRDIRAFFPPTPQRKDLARHFLPYFDGANEEIGSIDELVSLTQRALESFDLLSSYFALAGLTATCVRQPRLVMPKLLEQFENAKQLADIQRKSSSARPIAPVATPILTMIGQSVPYPQLVADGHAESMLDMYGRLVLEFEAHFGGMCRGTFRQYYWTELAEYSYWHYYLHGTTMSGIMRAILDEICRERNTQKLRFVIRRFAHVARCSLWRAPTVALDGLRELIVRLDKGLQVQLETEIAEAVASIRAVDPDKVDEFIESFSDSDLSARLLGRMRSTRPYINMGYVLGDAVIVFVKALLVDKDTEVRDFLRTFILIGTESRSFESWLTGLVLDLADLVGGSFLSR